MNNSVVQVADGQYSVAREGLTTKKQSMVNFHQVCTNLWNDEGTNRAEVRLVDENFNIIDSETIDKVEPTPRTIVSIVDNGDTYTVNYSDGTSETVSKEQPEEVTD